MSLSDKLFDAYCHYYHVLRAASAAPDPAAYAAPEIGTWETRIDELIFLIGGDFHGRGYAWLESHVKDIRERAFATIHQAT